MVSGFETVWFLSDFGLVDEFVGVVKAVIRGFAPRATVIDLTHQIAPHDVTGGSLALARAMQYLGRGVVLAVVDPEVGSDRRAVAVEVGADPGGGDHEDAVGSGEARRVLMGPDNGLLAPAVAMAGGARRAVSITNPVYRLDAPGPTFAGRDVFAPAAAHMCLGGELSELGPEVDPLSLLPATMPLSRQVEASLVCQVLWVDHFGNVQLNVDPDELGGMPEQITVRCGNEVRVAARVISYSQLRAGQVGMLVDSYGLVALVVQRRSAADELGLAAGDEVTLEPAT